MRRLFGGTIIALGCICTGSSSSGSSSSNGLNGGSNYPGRPARGRSKSQTSQASRFNSGLSRGGGGSLSASSSSSLPSDDLLDFLDLDETTTANSYDASFFDDGNYGLDDSDGHESESMGDSDMGGGYELDDDVSEEEDFGQGSEKGALYDAYNLLHSLAQVCYFGLYLQISIWITSLTPSFKTGLSKAIRCTSSSCRWPPIFGQISSN